MDSVRCSARAILSLVILLGAPGLGAAADRDAAPAPATAPGVEAGRSPYARWSNGPPADDSFFPIAVWLQNPARARQYRQAGINLYIGLWKGPTEAQLAALKKAAMPVICHQNAVALRHKDDKTILAWMHGDEPDNAQSRGRGKGYGPPVDPKKIVADYRRIRAADPTRPVLLNLGQGVAWDAWHGRGTRTNHPEDYPAYLAGCDIASFDIYPAVHRHKDVAGKLWFVPRGVDRLRRWSGGARPVWNCIECTRIHSPDRKATPHQVRAEVWMSLIHGSMGLIYFVHDWKPAFNEHALLDDAEMLRAVTALNRQIRELAPVLNSPTVVGAAVVSSSQPRVPIDLMVKRRGGTTYLFAAGMRDGRTRGTFTVNGQAGRRTVEVLGEGRTLLSEAGRFEDAFKPWDVHLYVIR